MRLYYVCVIFSYIMYNVKKSACKFKCNSRWIRISILFTKKIFKQLLKDREMLTFWWWQAFHFIAYSCFTSLQWLVFSQVILRRSETSFQIQRLTIGTTKYFYLFNLPLVVLVPLGRQKIHCSMDSSFPSSQLFSSSSQSACLSDLKAWSLHMGLWVVMVKNCFEFHNHNKK